MTLGARLKKRKNCTSGNPGELHQRWEKCGNEQHLQWRGPSGGGCAARKPGIPCSIQQQQFWVLDRLEPGNPAMNVAVRWQLDGHVVVDVL